MKRKWMKTLLFLMLLLWGWGNVISVKAEETSLKVPTSPGALVSVGAVPYRYVNKTWSQWEAYFNRLGYSYSHCYYEVEVRGADRYSKESDVCWCAFTKGGKVYWSALQVNTDGTYTIATNHWDYIGPSTNPGSPGGTYTGNGAHWYFTNGDGLIYQDSWIYVPISTSNINRLGYFYVNASGHMLTGWNRDTAGNWYYFKIDTINNEDGASVKTGVSEDRNRSTVCWTEVKRAAGNGSYGLYRYDGIDVRTNFYIMNTKGEYPASYHHSTTTHATASQVPPLNPQSSVSYDSAAASGFLTTGFYQDTSRGNCGQNQQVYLTNTDWQSVSVDAFHFYIGRRQYTQTISYRRKQQGVWNVVEGDTKIVQAYYGSVFSLDSGNKTYTGYIRERILRNNQNFSGSEYTVLGNNQIYMDYRPIQYTVSYYGNGADGGNMPDNTYDYDSTALLRVNQYSRANYRFKGWALTPVGTAVYSDQARVENWTTQDGARICLYAVWEQIMAPVTIRVYRMNVTGTDYFLKNEKNISVGMGSQMTLSRLAQSENTEGFHYAYGTVNGGRMEQMQVSSTGGCIIALYFDRNQYSLTISGESGLNQIQGAGNYYYGASVRVSAELAEGYSFLQWQTTGIPESKELKFSFSMPACSVTINGKTRAHTYQIVFDGNGATAGDMSDAAIHAVYGGKYTLPVNQYQRVTDQGESVFCGWSIDSGTRFGDCEYRDGQQVSNVTAEDGATITFYAIWDDMPGIAARDLYYTLEEAQNGVITYELLMEQASAYDREEITQENPSGEIPKGRDETRGTQFGILDYSGDEFISFSHGGSVTVTYQAVDAGGNRTRKQIRIYLVDTAARSAEEQKSEVRFISSRYLTTLPEDSKWRKDSSCAGLLDRALNGEEDFATYEFLTGAIEE